MNRTAARPPAARARDSARAPHPHRHDLEARRMSVIAAIRPDSWNFPLFLHVLGAMILVGGLLTGASALLYARGEARFLRLGYWTLACGRAARASSSCASVQVGSTRRRVWDDLPDEVSEPAWLGIGLVTADRRRPPLSHLADRRRDRRVSTAREQGRGSPEGDDGHLARPARGVRRRGVGDVRQAGLEATETDAATEPEAGFAGREA